MLELYSYRIVNYNYKLV